MRGCSVSTNSCQSHVARKAKTYFTPRKSSVSFSVLFFFVPKIAPTAASMLISLAAARLPVAASTLSSSVVFVGKLAPVASSFCHNQDGFSTIQLRRKVIHEYLVREQQKSCPTSIYRVRFQHFRLVLRNLKHVNM